MVIRRAERRWEVRLRAGGHWRWKVVAQPLALNSSVLSGVMGGGARKRFDQDLRREDWNLFGRKIKGRLRFIRESGLILWDLDEDSRIGDEKLGPTLLGLRGARRIEVKR